MEKPGGYSLVKDLKKENLIKLPTIVCRVYERRKNPLVHQLNFEERGIPNCEVSLVRWESKTEGILIATITTDQDGICYFPELPVGIYTLDISGETPPTALTNESFIAITPVTSIILKTIRTAPQDILLLTPNQLTPSQIEIFKLLIQGLTSKEIAARRYNSPKTIDNTRKQIFQKIGVESVTELVALAFQNNWLDSEMKEELRYRFGENIPLLETLGRGEREIFNSIAQGLTTEQIASARQTSPRTVDAQIQIIHEKLGVRRRAELAVLYYLGTE